jgi:chemotaxis protein MotB
MSGSNLEPTEPRIVKKKKVSGPHHGGAWKVAYADFVTAMMALFIVLWIMSQDQSIRQAVAQYFQNPGVLPGATGIMESSDMVGKMPIPGHSQDLQTPSPIPPEANQDRHSLEEVKKRIEEMIAQLPEMQNLKNQVLMEITPEGLRIELLERENSNFFDIGSANLKPETQKILNLIAQELGRLPNKVTIEGHTDSRPYGGQSYTNWELSSDRANAARRLMEATGLKTDQVFAVRGFADRHLRNAQDPLDFQNRRVSIIVMFQNQEDAASLGAPTGAGKSSDGPGLSPNLHQPEKPDQPGTGAEAAPTTAGPARPPPNNQTPAKNGPTKPLDNHLSEEVKQLLKPLKPQIRLGW